MDVTKHQQCAMPSHLKLFVIDANKIKSESKKIGHFLLLIIWYWEPSEYFWIKKGQNDLFQALKWGIVCLSTSNGSRDMTKRNNSIIWNFHDLV